MLGACRLHSAADGRLRWEVEARLLAGQEAEGVAARTNLADEVVEAYGSLFFDVADLLEHCDWVMAFVFGRPHLDGFTRDEVGLIWKTVGYRFGVVALDALIDTLYGGSAGSPRGKAVEYAPSLGAAFERFIDIMTIPVTDRNAAKLIRLDRLVRDLDLRAEAGTAGPVTQSVMAACELVVTAPAARKEPIDTTVQSVSDDPAGENRDRGFETPVRLSA